MSDTPKTAFTLALAAAAGLGVVVNAASTPTAGQALAPLLSPHVYVAGPGQFPWFAIAAAAGFVVGVLLVRWWPLALLAGTALSLPAAIEPVFRQATGYPTITYLALAGASLALVAVLGAAQEAVDMGAGSLGAALAGAAAGSGLLGATLIGAGYLARPWGDLTGLQAALALLSLAGGLLAVMRQRLGPRPWPGPWLILLGALAGLLQLVPVLVTNERVAAVLQVSEVSLERRRYVLVAIVGLFTLGSAALLASAGGVRAAAAAAAAALVQVGAIAPLMVVFVAVAFTPTSGLVFALLGFGAGCAIAATRWRTAFAGAGCLASALALLLASAATGGFPEKIVTRQAFVPAGLLLALLVFMVTCSVATAALAAAKRGGLPVVLGPITAALVAGGAGALTLTQLNNGEPESSYLAGAHHLDSSVALLAIAAAVVAVIGVTQYLSRQGSATASAMSPSSPH